jgi:transcriptional regulator with AAA-type ATPase domain/tetratricopeptide (TPR) repeat protein
MTGHPTDTILGETPALVALRDQIIRLAAFDRPGGAHVPTVLIQGETGTGKGLVARLIHASGARRRGPIVDVNCAAIPETMLEAELFGFEAGAFTDARRAKPGLFEAAAGGSLFLDEVDALPLLLQGKLLTAIEEKTVRRLGAVAPYRIDAKLIAATQKDLRELVGTRAFRADLFHRLAVVVLELPALRDRGDDVLRLAEHFLAHHGAAHGVTPPHLTDDARAWLRDYTWPGNVRELSHLMERVTLLGTDPEVGRDELDRLRVPLGPAVPRSAPAPAADDEAAQLRDALVRAGGNVVRAAQLLGIGRNALRHRMQRYGIERPTLDDLARAPVGRRTTRARPTAAPPPPAALEPSWEQKPVAVLAIDLVLPATAHEPWTAARRWQRTIGERVAGFGGVFVTRTATRLTAAFGVPRALEQLPERSVQSALAIQRLVADEADETRPEVRQAIHVGMVRVDTNAPEPAATIVPVGDTLALAERLLGHAGAGELLVSPQAARRIEASCELRPRALRVGEAERLDAAVVLGRRTRSDPLEAAAETRFVGRGRELELLRGAFENATNHDGQVALLVGEPGIGKSRLIAELRQRIAGAPHCWIEGRCASYATMAAFHPIVDAVRRLLGIDDRDDADGAAAKLAHGIETLGADLTWTQPFLQQLLGLRVADETVSALDSASRRSEIFRALKALFIGTAREGPLVLVVEDLHWIDPTSQEFLTFLADAVPATPMLLLCSYRPGHQQPFGDRTYLVRVSLRPLSAPEMAAVTGSVLGTADIPETLRGLIAAKAEGNPFFVEEVTRSLLEDGSLRRENGRVVLARQLDDIAVPDRIQDVLIARLDRLAHDARLAIQVASVIGREFALRLLERITEAGSGIRAHVEELRALELIYEKAAHPELAFMFKHALTHDVAYESVVADRRRELHRTIGLAIEELYADRLAELYETLAHHFERAEEWERALEYHERAATKAADTFANRAVIAHCRQALAIAERLGDRVPSARRQSLEVTLGAALFYTSEFRASADAYERAAALAADPGVRAHVLAAAAMSALWGHEYARVDATSEAAVAIVRRHGPEGADTVLRFASGWKAAICEGDMEVWRTHLDDAYRAATRLGDEGAVASLGLLLAMRAEWTGDYRRAIAISEEVVAAGRRLRLPHLVVWPEWFLGKAYCCLGDYGRAVARLTEGADVCRRIGDRAWTSRLLNTLGWCHAEIGAHDRAREYNERAAALAHAVGDPEIVSNSEINLAINWLSLGDLDRARAYLDPIRAALGRPGDPWMRWRYTLHLHDAVGRAALRERRPDDALAAAQEELAGARRFHAPKVAARAQVLRAETLLMLDRRDDAEETLAEATRIAQEISYPRGLWQALGLLAELAHRRGRSGDAARADARRREVVDAVARSLVDPDLGKAFARSVDGGL